MNDFIDLSVFDARLESVVFVLSLLAIVAASLCAVALLRKVQKVSRKRPLVAFWSDEEGASYSLSFVMTLPFYVMFMCVAVETMFMMVAKYGALHACQAAVRAAAVRASVATPEDRKYWIPQAAKDAAKKAAVVSMIPFASSLDPDCQGVANKDAWAYYDAYKDFIKGQSAPNDGDEFFPLKKLNDPVTSYCVTMRYESALKRIDVDLKIDPSVDKSIPKNEPWRKCITCELTYHMPFRLPLIGLMFGGYHDGNAVVADVCATASAQIECPKNEKGFLGVAIPWTAE